MAQPPIIQGPFFTPFPGSAVDVSPRQNRGRSVNPQFPPNTAQGVGVVPADAVPSYDVQRYGLANGTKVFSVAQASTPIILQPNTFRNFVWIRNSSDSVNSANVYIEFGGEASANSAIRLARNEQFMLDASVLQDDITAFADAAGGQISVLFANVTIPGV